jgi:NACalpha-BTF3-like transcription factor
MDFPLFFKVLKNIITKDEKAIEEITIDEDSYDQYLCNRYLSFYHPALLDLINKSTNRQNFIPKGDDILACYRFTKACIPKLPSRKIEYHKKQVSQKIQNLGITEEDIKLLAQKKEISVRELKEMLKYS